MSDVSALKGEGVEALRRGDAARARSTFERAIASQAGDAGLFVGLAYACRAQGDGAAMLAAAEGALALEPHNPRALILKADHLAASGDERSASSYYMAAVRAVPDVEAQPPDLRAEIARAAAACDRIAARFETFLRTFITNRDIPGALEGRFAESLDILVGRRPVQASRPRYYYFPGLASIAFHDRAAFPFLGELEAATQEIRDELRAVLASGPFDPYVRSDPRRPKRDQAGMADNPDWGAFYLWKDGELVTENAARCPRPSAAPTA